MQHLSKKHEERHYQLLQLLEENPELTQRELAEKLGISLGLVNYCIKGLADVGFIKMKNFSKSKNKLGYMYLLTPIGIIEKSKITVKFLASKQDEFEKLKKEIDELKAKVTESQK
jgi:EPS-associated MarR family transcriptional regulator